MVANSYVHCFYCCNLHCYFPSVTDHFCGKCFDFDGNLEEAIPQNSLSATFFTDLPTGLVTQSFSVAAEFISMEEPRIIRNKLLFLNIAKLVVVSFDTYFHED